MSFFRTTTDARRDWQYVADKARAQGNGELVIQCAPAEHVTSIAAIDRATDMLRLNLGWPSVREMRAKDGQP